MIRGLMDNEEYGYKDISLYVKKVVEK